MKSLSRGNSAFLATVAFFFVAAGAGLTADAFASRPVGVGKPIGTITYKNRQAEQKSNGTPLWNSVRRDGPVYNRDTIRTAAESSATIKLNDGTEIALNEESMVFIDLDPKRTTLNLTGGSVSVDNGASAAPVQLATRAGTVDLAGGRLQLLDGARGVEVSLETGKAAYRPAASTATRDRSSGALASEATGDARPGDGETPSSVAIAAHSNYNLSANTVSKLAFAPRLPVAGAIIARATGSAPIRFEWERVGPAPTDSSPRGVTLIIARDSAMRDVVASVSVDADFAEVALESGQYYWRLDDHTSGQPADGAVAQSPVRWFTVQRVDAPVPLSPAGASFTYLETPPLVSFSWSKVASASLYRLEIFSAAGGDPIEAKTVSDWRLSVAGLAPGSYTWRVVAIVGPERVEAASKPASFSVTKGTLAAPVLSAELPSVSYLAAQRGKPILSWPAVPGADRYEVVLARDAAALARAAPIETSYTYLTLAEPPAPGAWFVAVRARSGAARSADSAVARLNVAAVAPLVAREPLADAVAFAGKGETSFAWEDPNSGSSYRLLVAADSGFASIVSQVSVSSPRAKLSLSADKGSELFWKAQLLDAKGVPVAETESRPIRLLSRLASAAPISPVAAATIDINRTDAIRFSWRPVKNAVAYRLSLMRATGGLRSTVSEWTASGTETAFTDFSLLAVGDYAWSITPLVVASATSESGKAAFADGESTLSYFNLIQGSALPAPTLRRVFLRGGERK